MRLAGTLVQPRAKEKPILGRCRLSAGGGSAKLRFGENGSGMSVNLKDEAAELLYREAASLDRQDWDNWLALFAEDVEFWVPAWKSETAPTDDPDREISLLYYPSRLGLEERVQRLRTGKSITMQPAVRTAHMIGNILLGAASDSSCEVEATWTVHLYDPRLKTQHVLFGRYEYQLRRVGERWLIARKKILLLNDHIPTMIDFYCL
jgi:3-phenylpropionate/cinnamic acid dioxygenase small subunit